MLSYDEAQALIKENERLTNENKKLIHQFELALKSIDRSQAEHQEKMEVGMKVMAGICLKKLGRRKVVIEDHDIESFDINECQDSSKSGGIEYSFTGGFE